MVEAVSSILEIVAGWERLDTGEPEERACFAALGIRHGSNWLTEAEDQFVGRIRQQVHLSAYGLAEWLAWNWWRLRWEPRAQTEAWVFAHRLTTIGGGYVWPNITIMSDGERVVLLAKPTKPRPAEPLRYVSDLAAVVRATEFEGAVDLFLTQVLEQLRSEGIKATNLDQIWSDTLEERADPDAAAYRRIESMLGFDPDEAPPSVIERLLADAPRLGSEAVAEVAAHQPVDQVVPTADDISRVAADNGFDATPCAAVRLASTLQLPPRDQAPAWRRGAEAARAIRAQEVLGAAPISNERLCMLAGVSPQALADRSATDFTFSFGLDQSPSVGRVVLRSKWETGRRFDLARLIGDRVAGGSGDRLLPATRAHTYRQKLQRSFAAELLCPFTSLEEVLHGDYSSEAIGDAAAYFNVSELAVRTLLVNHGRLDREDLEGDIESTAAA